MLMGCFTKFFDTQARWRWFYLNPMTELFQSVKKKTNARDIRGCQCRYNDTKQLQCANRRKAPTLSSRREVIGARDLPPPSETPSLRRQLKISPPKTSPTERALPRTPLSLAPPLSPESRPLSQRILTSTNSPRFPPPPEASSGADSPHLRGDALSAARTPSSSRESSVAKLTRRRFPADSPRSAGATTRA